jgi:transmembrane sensor
MSQQRPCESAGMKQARRMMAADWLQRVNSEGIADAELSQWLEWYSQNEDNRRAFDQADSFFKSLRAMPPSGKDALRKLAATKAAGVAARRTRARARLLPWSLAALLLIGVTAALWQLQWVPFSSQTHRTARAEHRKLELPDGSIAVMGAQSALQIDFDSGRRTLKVVSGEAFFQVKRDPLRPFVVEAWPATVTAIGTAFDVQRTADRVTVAVIEGAVEVQQAESSAASGTRGRTRVSAGERAVLSAISRTRLSSELKVTPVDPAAAIGWQSGQLSFAGEPLSGVIETVNRYSKRRILIRNASVGRMTFTGTVQSERVEEWVMNLPRAFPLRAVALEDGTFELYAVKKNSH